MASGVFGGSAPRFNQDMTLGNLEWNARENAQRSGALDQDAQTIFNTTFSKQQQSDTTYQINNPTVQDSGSSPSHFDPFKKKMNLVTAETFASAPITEITPDYFIEAVINLQRCFPKLEIPYVEAMLRKAIRTIHGDAIRKVADQHLNPSCPKFQNHKERLIAALIHDRKEAIERISKIEGFNGEMGNAYFLMSSLEKGGIDWIDAQKSLDQLTDELQSLVLWDYGDIVGGKLHQILQKLEKPEDEVRKLGQFFKELSLEVSLGKEGPRSEALHQIITHPIVQNDEAIGEQSQRFPVPHGVSLESFLTSPKAEK